MDHHDLGHIFTFFFALMVLMVVSECSNSKHKDYRQREIEMIRQGAQP